jgi:hypothetical protein
MSGRAIRGFYDRRDAIPNPPLEPRWELVDPDLLAALKAAEVALEAKKAAYHAAQREASRVGGLDAQCPTSESLAACAEADNATATARADWLRGQTLFNAMRRQLVTTQHERARERCASLPAERAKLVEALSALRLALAREFYAALASPRVRDLEAQIAERTAAHVELEGQVRDAKWILRDGPDECRIPYVLAGAAREAAHSYAICHDPHTFLLTGPQDAREVLGRSLETLGAGRDA